ncbi:PSD1 and planctomycete cytochrome C domain-containing protein [Stratiformator vulcanicus]|uniref:Planctomycete cytochrome C n=1 Tax=Stratiformator vulcanicus TaxID=2527980 RepID=A0A517R1E6_9PLAN|nr:PSD1 and planctomycete cytochrome C domain-containing protein [Stratiformator vulcanicus]QDT37719.1 Planctomycete cytochrome C [Stratiformator vulcanicus]
MRAYAQSTFILMAVVAGLAAVMNLNSAAADETDAGLRFFEAKIRPALIKHCYECHSTESGKAKGGLRVDTRDALLRGGEGGPAVVAKSTTRSLLYEAILYEDGGYQMPPKGKLPAQVIADFRKWILMGAPDPRVTRSQPAVATEIDIEQGRNYWAYRQPQEAKPSMSTDDWLRTTIDRFVHQSQRLHGVSPVADADARTLIRRLHFVLTGLPPSRDAAQEWKREIEAAGSVGQRQRVISNLIDELLASPRFGEHWGRHWMDVARFAESTGGDQNNIYPHAWRYRDYVIDSFNSDKPFDDFIKQQIAGDLLPIEDDQEWGENVVATGFLAIGVKFVGEEDQQKYLADLVDEQVDTTTRAFLATTVACARCHDHKFDPIPQHDYYAMAGIFRSTATHYGLLRAQARQATTLLDLTGMGLPAGTPQATREELAQLQQDRDDAEKALSDAMSKIRSGENVFRGTLRRLRSQRDETAAALLAYGAGGEARVLAMGTQDHEFPLRTRLLVRGELDKPAQEVSRGVLQVLSESGKNSFPPTMRGSGRVELAEWIASKDNPLTARVMANRIWHWMFGRGLVRTVDDFGESGDRPSNPELLDYLATRFVDEDWSTKSLIREIAQSRTWQLSSQYDEADAEIDPDNRYLWRANRRRLEAESIRDAMLAVSGQLEVQRPAGTLLRSVGEGGVGQNVFEPDIRAIETNCRSVYLPRVRGVLPEVIELFDAPDAGLVTGARESTASPLQALYLMNNAFVQEQAIDAAGRTKKGNVREQVADVFHLVLGRSPTAVEAAAAEVYLANRLNSVTQTQIQSDQPGRNDRGFGRRGRGRGQRSAIPADEPPVTEAAVTPMPALAELIQALMCTAEFQQIN